MASSWELWVRGAMPGLFWSMVLSAGLVPALTGCLLFPTALRGEPDRPAEGSPVFAAVRWLPDPGLAGSIEPVGVQAGPPTAVGYLPVGPVLTLFPGPPSGGGGAEGGSRNGPPAWVAAPALSLETAVALGDRSIAGPSLRTTVSPPDPVLPVVTPIPPAIALLLSALVVVLSTPFLRKR